MRYPRTLLVPVLGIIPTMLYVRVPIDKYCLGGKNVMITPKTEATNKIS